MFGRIFVISASRARWVTYAACAAMAAVLVTAVTITTAGPVSQRAVSTVSQSKSSPLQLSGLERRELERLTPTQRARVARGMALAFSKVGRTGTGEVPGSTTLTAKDFTYGYDGHFWVIASYADMLNPAIDYLIGRAEGECTDFASEFPWPVELAIVGICVKTGSYLKNMAHGWGWSNSHGVWAAVYVVPPEMKGGRW